VAKSETLAKPAVADANAEYDKQADPNTPIPTPPVHAARLAALLKSLATAEGAVADSIKARKVLVEGLTKLLEQNKEALSTEESQLYDINARKTEIGAKRQEVEEAIMRGLTESNGDPGLEPQRPEAEPLTPPMQPVESVTPIGTPTDFLASTTPNKLPEPEPFALGQDTKSGGVPLMTASTLKRQPSNASPEEHTMKSRKFSGISAVDEFAEFANDGPIDADVEALLQ
jgi:regulator of Ty1 transposition protein 103